MENQSKASLPILIKRYTVLRAKKNKVESYKDEHPGTPDTAIKDMYMEKTNYPKLVTPMEFALLTTSTTTDVEDLNWYILWLCVLGYLLTIPIEYW